MSQKSEFSYKLTKQSVFTFFLIFLTAILVSLRSDNSPDTEAYRIIYENSLNGGMNLEYLYLIINQFFNRFEISFDLYLIIITILLFIFWFVITKRITAQIFIAFISFLPFYGLYFYGITLRAAIAVTICYLAIVLFLNNNAKKMYIVYFLLIILASGFHITALIFFLLPVIAQFDFKKSALFIFLFIVSLLPLFSTAIPFIKELAFGYLEIIEVGRLNNYITSSSESMTYSLSFLKSIVFGGIFIFFKETISFRQNVYNFFLNTYLLGCLLLALFSFVTAGSRLAMLFLFFEFILITLVYESSYLKKGYTYIFIASAMVINFVAIIQKGNGLLW